MADTVSEEELEAKRAEVAKLREQIADEEAAAAVRRREQERVIEAAQLDAEAARLQLQLDASKQEAKAAGSKAVVAGAVLSAKEQMRLAEEQQAALSGGETKGAPKDPSPEEVEKAEAKAAEKDKEKN